MFVGVVVVEGGTETYPGLVKMNYLPTAPFVCLLPPEALPQQNFIGPAQERPLSLWLLGDTVKWAKVNRLVG